MNEYVETKECINLGRLFLVITELVEKYGTDAKISFETLTDQYELVAYDATVFRGNPPYTEIGFNLKLI